MQTSSAKLITFAALASGAAADSAQASPLGQVFKLLTDLTSKVKEEGASQDQAYGEYSSWCAEVSTNTKFEIKTGNSRVAKLEAGINEAASEIEVCSSKIEELAATLSKNEKELKAATSIRKKESTDFQSGEKELMEVIDSVGRAVNIIEKEMNKGAAAFAQVDTNSLASIVGALGNIADAAAFSVTDKDRLLALVQSSSDDDDSMTLSTSSAASSSKSSGIVDTLEDLKEKSESQLGELRKAEVAAKQNYDMLKQSLEDEMSADTKDMDTQKMDKAAAEEAKATAEGELSVQKTDMDASIEALEVTHSNCMRAAQDHDASVNSRVEELKVIATAVKILQDATKDSAASSFMQVGATAATGIARTRSHIVMLVKRLAKTHHSAALAQLASRISTVERYGNHDGADPFAKIRGMISDMISKLEKEAGAEAEEKAYCDGEMSKTKAKKDEVEAAMSKLTTKIDQSAAESQSLKGEVTKLQGELAAITQEAAQMDKIRQEEHADYVEGKDELAKGLTGVRKALVVLRDYYAKDEGSASLLQDGESFEAAMQQKQKKQGGAAAGIIGILEVVESDFATNLAKIETEEESAQETFEKMTKEFAGDKISIEQDVKYKTRAFTGLDRTVAELSSDRDTMSTEQSAVLEYWTKLNERCVAKPESYEEKKKRRDAEVAGLKEALATLESEGAFIQRKNQKHHHMRGASLSTSSESE